MADGEAHEEVYLKAYANGLEAHRGLREYFRFYNERRPHQAPWATGRRRRSSTASLWKRKRILRGCVRNRSQAGLSLLSIRWTIAI